jgi:hypothetical protein
MISNGVCYRDIRNTKKNFTLWLIIYENRENKLVPFISMVIVTMYETKWHASKMGSTNDTLIAAKHTNIFYFITNH